MAVILRQTENYDFGNAKVAIPPPPPRMWYQSNTALEKGLPLAQIPRKTETSGNFYGAV